MSAAYETPLRGWRVPDVKLVLEDVDGITVPPKYDTTGRIQSGPDERTDYHFEKLREYCSDKENVPVLLTSGRSLDAITGIAKRMGNNNLIIHEHGIGVYDQSTGADVCVIDKIPEIQHYMESVDRLNALKPQIEDKFGSMKKDLYEAGYKKVDKIVMAPGKRFSVAVDIPYNGEYGRSDRVDRIDFAKSVIRYIPDSEKKGMFTQQEELRDVIPESEGSILVMVDGSAVNLKPPLSKPVSLKYLLSDESPLMKKYDVEEEEVALVDDRDIDSIRAMPGSVWTVNDGSREVREEVRRRYVTDGMGYSSLKDNIEGLREILGIINGK